MLDMFHCCLKKSHYLNCLFWLNMLGLFCFIMTWKGGKGVFPPKMGFLSQGNTNRVEGMAELAGTWPCIYQNIKQKIQFGHRHQTTAFSLMLTLSKGVLLLYTLEDALFWYWNTKGILIHMLNLKVQDQNCCTFFLWAIGAFSVTWRNQM